MDTLAAELVVDITNDTGECPIWSPFIKKLIWTDIPSGKLFTYDPISGEHCCIYEGRQVGGFTLQTDGSLVLCRDKGNVVVWKDGEELKTVVEAVPAMHETRFNDVIATPGGSIITGTISTDELAGQLYQVFSDGSYKVLLDGQGTPNGMAFSKDLKHMFYQDSRKNTLYRFDYDVNTDELSNCTVVINQFETDYPGRGDGLCMDEQDQLFSARYGGSAVLKENTSGIANLEIQVPDCANVTCCNFGGESMTDLYITSAGGSNRVEHGVLSGSLFKVSLAGQGYKGKQEFTTNF